MYKDIMVRSVMLIMENDKSRTDMIYYSRDIVCAYRMSHISRALRDFKERGHKQSQW